MYIMGVCVYTHTHMCTHTHALTYIHAPIRAHTHTHKCIEPCGAAIVYVCKHENELFEFESYIHSHEYASSRAGQQL
jgi:hypothetical protein